MPGGPVKITSLAVLPLLNLSGDPEQDYLADGMTEQLIASLARLKALRVISRTSAMAYKDTKKSLPEISKELNVDGILEGSVLKSGDRVQFTVQLVHAPTDNHLWAETYQRNLEDILTVQNELAEAIANEIQLQLTPQEQKQLAVRKTVNPEAHIDYLKGRYYFAKFTEPDFKTALGFFQSALQKDPSYAPAYAGIADVYVMMSDSFLPPSECMPKAKAAALKALELDPNLPEAHTSLAAVKFYYDWDWIGTNEELQRALNLNPNYAEAHRIRASYFASQKRNQESVGEIGSAVELDPFSFLINSDVASTAFFLREYDLAIRHSRNALELIPSSQSPRATLILALIYKGDSQSAASEIDLTDKKALLEESPLNAAVLASAEALVGRKKDATEYLAKLMEISKHRFVCPYELAITEYHLGNMDRVFPLLEHAYQHRSICMVWLRTDPRFDRLRDDPRYQDLMKRVGI
jgi:TolB-like protein/Tfp pilus assembly protein PilF